MDGSGRGRPGLGRTGWLSVVLLAVLVAGAIVRASWPDSKSHLDCAPEQVELVVQPGGIEIARCAVPASTAVVASGAAAPERTALRAQAALAIGAAVDLNRASEQDLALIHGVGKRLAHSLVQARQARGPFRSWDDVDAVSGVGPAKLHVLQQATRLGAR